MWTRLYILELIFIGSFFIMNEIRIFESELKNGTGKIILAYAIYSSASLMPPFVIAKAASASGISGES